MPAHKLPPPHVRLDTLFVYVLRPHQEPTSSNSGPFACCVPQTESVARQFDTTCVAVKDRDHQPPRNSRRLGTHLLPRLILAISLSNATAETSPDAPTGAGGLDAAATTTVESARSSAALETAYTLDDPKRSSVADDADVGPDAVLPRTPGERVWIGLKLVASFLLAQWFVIGIGVVVALAHAYPNVGRTGGIIKAQYTIKYLLIAIIFFISGLSLPLVNLYRRGLDWKLHLVTQATSFLVFPTIVFAIVSCVKASDPNFERFDKFALVGMIVMGCLPATVSSNVVMTGQAGGDQSATTIEVMLGNLLGTFLSPALLQMFLSAPGWEFGQPKATGAGGTGEIYRQVIEQLRTLFSMHAVWRSDGFAGLQLGCSVFVPLFIGEVLQYIWPKQVKWTRETFKLAKVGSLCLLGVIWSTFSTAFYAGAFQILSASTLIFILLVNVALYVVLSLLLFVVARKVPFPSRRRRDKSQDADTKDTTVRPREWERGPLFDPSTTIALLFCGAAKGIALGAPITQILYGGIPALEAATITVPLVLFQGSQVVLGQITVAILKAWMRRVKLREKGAKDVETRVETEEGSKDNLEGLRAAEGGV